MPPLPHIQDGLPELASEMGFPVFTVPTSYGLTSSMNRAWKYFTSFDALQSLFIMNNDIQVAPTAFSKLHRCLMKQPVAGAVARGDMGGGGWALLLHVGRARDGPAWLWAPCVCGGRGSRV
jgi:hypothetical protein